ncbi:MAG: hypothetical protein K2K84_09495 [Muribaculaceae bacterium]|nr:hypothetical protein [Muribaculaceae bacterium]
MKKPGEIFGDAGFSALTAMLRLTACLPLGALYVASDVLAFFACKVVKYRRRVVRENLAACFPDKTPD